MLTEETKQSIMREVLRIKAVMEPEIIERQKAGMPLDEDDQEFLEFSLMLPWEYQGLLQDNFRRARPESAALLENHGLMMETFRWLGTLLTWRIMEIEDRLLSDPNFLNEPRNPPLNNHMQNLMRIQHAKRQAEEAILPTVLLEEMPDGVPEPELPRVKAAVKVKLEARQS